MGYSDIVDTPIELDLRYVKVDDTPPPDQQPPDHYLNAPSGWATRAVIESMLPESDATALKRMLTRPLDQAFQDAWSNSQQMRATQDKIRAALQQSRTNAYDISVSLPTQGTLRAEVVSGFSSGLLETVPPGTTGVQLTLSYLLPGIEVRWSETTGGIWGKWADPGYKADFDGELRVYVAVPDDSEIPLGVKAEFSTSNPDVGATDLFGWLSGLTDAIGNWLTEQPNNPPAGQTLLVDAGSLGAALATASAGFATAARYGFIRLSAFVDTNPPHGAPEGNTVTFVLTHPIDPAPTIGNPVAEQQSLFVPLSRIGTSAPTVNAGGSVGVAGVSFPASQARTLQIGWSDTTSGQVASSEIQWGLAPAQGRPPSMPATVSIPRQSYDNANTYTVRTLQPSTTYAFRVRDYDVPELIATQWSDWLYLTTSASDRVDLVLEDGQNTVVGNASVQFDGTFAATANIPAAEQPGQYKLWAVTGGEEMAFTTITVVAAGQQLGPTLEVIDPATSLPFTSVNIAMTNRPVNLRGANFAPGDIDLHIDSPTGAALGTVQGDQNGAFTAAVTWPYVVIGQHTAVAVQGALKAVTAAFEVENPPK